MRIWLSIYVVCVVIFSSSNLCGQEAVLKTYMLNGLFEVNSWKNIRDNSIEKQDEDYSCGSASLATILHSFYGLNVYEKDILDEVEKIADDGTASFSDLEKVVQTLGFKGIGLSLSFEKLKSIKIPAIVYLRYRGDDHFSVIRGISEDGTVWLGDPSWGNRKFTEHQFKKKWETRDDEKLKGKLLLIIPKDKFTVNLDKDFFHPPKVNRTAIELLTIRR